MTRTDGDMASATPPQGVPVEKARVAVPPMRLGYADPPYPGQSKKHYGDHPDYAGEVDHAELIQRLERDYDGWLLHTSSTALSDVLRLCPDGVRVMAWVKPFAAFKRNVPVAYAWEPVIVKEARKPTVGRIEGMTLRDWVSCNITMKKGLSGVKPEQVCFWAFEVLGAEPDDELHDLFPGSGAVTDAWERWRSRIRLDDDWRSDTQAARLIAATRGQADQSTTSDAQEAAVSEPTPKDPANPSDPKEEK